MIGLLLQAVLVGVGQSAERVLPPKAEAVLIEKFPQYFRGDLVETGRAMFGAFWYTRADFDGNGTVEHVVLGKDSSKQACAVVVLEQQRGQWSPLLVGTWEPPQRAIGIEMAPAGVVRDGSVRYSHLPILVVTLRDDASGGAYTLLFQRDRAGWHGSRPPSAGR